MQEGVGTGWERVVWGGVWGVGYGWVWVGMGGYGGYGVGVGWMHPPSAGRFQQRPGRMYNFEIFSHRYLTTLQPPTCRHLAGGPVGRRCLPRLPPASAATDATYRCNGCNIPLQRMQHACRGGHQHPRVLRLTRALQDQGSARGKANEAGN